MEKDSITDKELITGSYILFYYVKLYMESLCRLAELPTIQKGWDFNRNTLIEAHLSSARLLIYFLVMDNKSKREGDIYAKLYFDDADNCEFPLISPTLKNFIRPISRNNLHLTLGSFPELRIKSNQKYEIWEISKALIPGLLLFFIRVSDDRLGQGIKEKAIELLNDNPKLHFSMKDPITPTT